MKLRGMVRKAVSLVLVPIMLLVLAAPAFAVPSSPAKQLELLREIEKLIQENYLGETDVYELSEDLSAEDFDVRQEFFYDELDQLIGSMDEYSDYIPREFVGVMLPSSNEKLVGIGIVVDSQRSLGAYILKVVQGGAAAEAGLKADDQIVSVGGTDVRFMVYEDIVPLLRGEEGTKVKVGVRHPGALTDEYYTLERRPIMVSNVSGRALSDKIAYIKIDGFVDEADVEAFTQLTKHFGTLEMRDLVIDLRSNGGGVVEIMSQMMNHLPGTPGELMFTMSNSKTEERFIYESEGTWEPERILVLVNEGTASASEIMAGSLSDRGIAELVGVQTYGKARAQWHFELSDGDVLIVTSYIIELPKTGDYQAEGLTPDYEDELYIEKLNVAELEPLNTQQAILPGLSAPTRVKALERRLALMGFFLAEPDEIFDAYTLHALQSFQYAEGLTVTSYASVQTLTLLEGYMEYYDGYQYVPEDTQLAFVMELLEE